MLAGPGKGVQLMKLGKDDLVVGSQILRAKRDTLTLENEKGTQYDVTTRKYGVVSRGGKGHQLFRRGKLVSRIPPPPVLPDLDQGN